MRGQGPTRRCLIVIALWTLSNATNARAEEVAMPRVSLDLSACEEPFASEVRRIAGIELRAVVVDQAQPGAAVTRAVVKCHDAAADLWVSDSVTSKLVVRTVSLGETEPRARARLIALAVAELVSASWEEVESNPNPKVPAQTPAPARVRESVRHAIDRPERSAVDALFDARLLPSSGALLLGGAVRSSIRLDSPLHLRLEAGGDIGTVQRALGSVSIQTGHGSAALGWALDFGVVSALLWAGGTLGFARIAGQPRAAATGNTQSGLLVGPEAGCDFVLWPRALAHMMLGLSGGGALIGVRGDVQGDRSVAVLGSWFALRMGVGISSR
jgi:hypothetical protein